MSKETENKPTWNPEARAAFERQVETQKPFDPEAFGRKCQDEGVEFDDEFLQDWKRWRSEDR